MNIKAIIVEDQLLSADILKKFCDRSGHVNVLHHFINAVDAGKHLLEHEIDLVFLDVEMPGPSGFDLLDQLVIKPQVIMTTAETSYAYTAFQYNVCDYLKKPYTYARFLEAIEKAVASMQHSSQRKSKDEEIYIKCNGQVIRLKTSEILYMESMGDYVRFVTQDKKYITHNSMKKLLSQIDTDIFCQVHRSYIINMGKLNDFRDNNASIEGHLIPVSKANKAKVLKHIKILS